MSSPSGSVEQRMKNKHTDICSVSVLILEPRQLLLVIYYIRQGGRFHACLYVGWLVCQQTTELKFPHNLDGPH